MKELGKVLLRSIYQGKWVDIYYRNQTNEETHYWIFIKTVIHSRRMLVVDSFNISKSSEPTEYNIFIDSILSAKMIDLSYHKKNMKLIEEIETFPDNYSDFFDSNTNLDILDYLVECNMNNVTPERVSYILVGLIDEDTIAKHESYKLNEIQFEKIVSAFQNQLNQKKEFYHHSELAMNIMSIVVKQQNLYVLAYKKMFLDIEKKELIADGETTVNREYIDGDYKYSISRYISEEDLPLLDDFDKNRKQIFKAVESYNINSQSLTDSPFIIELGRKTMVDLNKEFSGIYKMYDENSTTIPIKAFFGEMRKKAVRKKNYPITIIEDQINIDQLLAIHKAMKYPITYVQGPPGTGKTNTIINLILTAFFNDKTMLITSYNNHPMNNIFEKIRDIKYGRYQIPFPIIRLGNEDKVLEALDEIKRLIGLVEPLEAFDEPLNKMKISKQQELSELEDVLAQYELRLDLIDRKKAIEDILNKGNSLNFSTNVQANQLEEIKRKLASLDFIKDETALAKIDSDYNEFKKYLNFMSIKYIKRLNEPKYKVLMDIIEMDDKKSKKTLFNKYLSNSENLNNFLRVFPIVVTTNISAYHLGGPSPHFDITVMDEASQCDQATALIPIIRGNNLMLVGDPQQLNPVVVLDKKFNTKIMNKYNVPQEYNFIENSIYKTYISADSISDEFLLKYHYRCHRKIIDFNNKKYYNNKLIIKSESREESPLVFLNNGDKNIIGRNTSEAEADGIITYIKEHPEEDIGIITPFVRQKEYITQRLIDEGLSNSIPCGTVHTFQGDQKGVILFSTAITNQTLQKSYDWLKNNRELINVATSRAKNKLIMFGNEKEIKRLNRADFANDFFELYNYIRTNGISEVTRKLEGSRALGIKPYSSELEQHFMSNLTHALEITTNKCYAKKEVGIKSIFHNSEIKSHLFYTGVFDFVVFEKINNKEIPRFAIELNGPEHYNDEAVKKRDKEKEKICNAHNFHLIIVKNVYARRYSVIKDLMASYFGINNK